jgi:hypothetical protein
MGDKARAAEIYDKGLEVAAKAGDERAVGEIGTAKAQL